MINVPPTQMVSDPRYAFVVGKIRSLETRLLNNQQVARLLETKDAQALWAELAACADYEEHLAQLTDPNDYEQLLSAELKRVYQSIFELTPDPGMLSLLSLRYDFHNCKVFSKAQFLGEDPGLAISDLGAYPVKEWEQVLAGEVSAEKSGLPRDLLATVLETQASLEEETDLRLRDMQWDQALYGHLYRRAMAGGSVFIQTWVRLRVDCLNLTALMRCKLQNTHKRTLERALFNNGLIPKERLLAAYEGNLDDLPSQVAASPYAELVQEGIQTYLREGSFSYWEKLTDDFEIEFLKQARMAPLGVEPLFAYLLAKENEIKVLRIILVGKLNRLSKAEISKRVRRLYA